jgi:hypothetical protein
MGTQVVVRYSDPALTWEISKLCLGCASKFRLARQPGLVSLSRCRGPVMAAFFGFSPTVPGRYFGLVRIGQ